MSANWNTFKGHNAPETFIYLGRDRKPEATGRVCRMVKTPSGNLRVVDAESGDYVDNFGVAGKFWAAPVTEAVDEDAAALEAAENEGLAAVAEAAEDSAAEPTPSPSEDATGSAVVRLLEKVWARIREDHPELPDVVIVTGSGMIGGSRWGHFRADGWKIQEEGAAIRKHELFLAGEALAKGARQTLQTMIHEATHTLARVRNIQDTSRQGRWHNAKFKTLAEEMGLEHKRDQADKSHGFSFVTLTEATIARYADLLDELEREIRLVINLPLWLGGTQDEDEAEGGEKIGGAGGGKPTKGQGSTSNNLKCVCRCETPRIIRVSRKVLEEAGIMCRECGEDFEAA